MALTPGHVAQVHHALEDPGPDPALAYHTDEDYDAVVRGLMASHPGGPDTWLFAYGSLIWRPELEHVEARRGTAWGWHRSFCFRIERFRAPRERPALLYSAPPGQAPSFQPAGGVQSSRALASLRDRHVALP